MLPITGIELIALIPQKPPFVMIDTLITTDGIRCTTAFTILADNVLCDDGKLNPSGLLENIAQTAAVMSGYSLKMENKERLAGFIGNIRDFAWTQLPAIGDEIITEVTLDNKVFDVTIITGRIKLGTEEIASCNMKIFKAIKND